MQFTLALSICISVTSGAAQDQTISATFETTCGSISPMLNQIFLDASDGNISDDERTYLANARQKLFDKFQQCTMFLKASAEADYKKSKQEVFKNKALSRGEMAKGIEAVLNGSKQICPNNNSQGTEFQEFSCYLRIVEALEEMWRG